MTDTFATVGYDSDAQEWSVVYGDAYHSKHDTKQAAIDAASEIDTVNTVMAFTKGNSNMKSIRC